MTAPVSRALAAAMIAQLPALRRYAVALSGNATLADDLVQDGIERALNRAGTLQIRRRRVRGVVVDMADMANDLALSTAPASHSGMAELTRAMATLSVEHRQILVLAGVEELSYREIADELSIPLGTVMSRLARARGALRSALDSPAPSARLEQRA